MSTCLVFKVKKLSKKKYIYGFFFFFKQGDNSTKIQGDTESERK